MSFTPATPFSTGGEQSKICMDPLINYLFTCRLGLESTKGERNLLLTAVRKKVDPTHSWDWDESQIFRDILLKCR